MEFGTQRFGKIEAEAAQPHETVHCWVHGNGVAESWEDPLGKHIGNTQSSE